MAKKTTTEKTKALTLAQKFCAQQRALEAGKAGYKRADELLDEIEAQMKANGIMGQAVDLGDGQTGRMVDKFAQKSSCGAGLKVRRYEIEVTRAEAIAKQL